MGLHLCYELSLPAEASLADASAALEQLRARALELPFDDVSALVVQDERALATPSTSRGLRFDRIEDVVHVSARLVRDALYRDVLRDIAPHGSQADDGQGGGCPSIATPDDVPVASIGFAIDPGRGSEPASFGLVRLDGPSRNSRWWWHWCCKTQYASVVSNEHLIRCHTGLVSVLDAAAALGLGIEVRDEAGYWSTRDEAQLVANVAEMNRMVAGFAGAFTDAVREAGGDSRTVGGAIFTHPDFERLETDSADPTG